MVSKLIPKIAPAEIFTEADFLRTCECGWVYSLSGPWWCPGCNKAFDHHRSGVFSINPDLILDVSLSESRGEALPVMDSRLPRGRKKSRHRGPPFVDREDCLTWLRERASMCVKEDWPINIARVAHFAIKTKRFRTEDPKNAAKTISRWRDYYQIDFTNEVEKYFSK